MIDGFCFRYHFVFNTFIMSQHPSVTAVTFIEKTILGDKDGTWRPEKIKRAWFYVVTFLVRTATYWIGLVISNCSYTANLKTSRWNNEYVALSWVLLFSSESHVKKCIHSMLWTLHNNEKQYPYHSTTPHEKKPVLRYSNECFPSCSFTIYIFKQFMTAPF